MERFFDRRKVERKVEANLMLSPPSPLLAARQIVKNYPGVRAVDGATLELWPGEVHELVGENAQ